MSEDGLDNRTLQDFLEETVPDYIGNVPPHWLESHMLSPEIQIYVAIIFIIICVPGNFGQILVFIAYFRSRRLHTASNRLLISLLSSDFILLVNCYIAVYQSFRGAPILGTLGCQTSGFLGSVAALAEIWSLAAVSFDRFKGIHYPLDNQKRTTKAQSNLMILLIWGIAIIFSLCPLVGWSQFVSESYLMGCAFNMYSSAWPDRLYGIALFFYCWIFPLLIILFSYIGIIYETRSSRKTLFRKEKKKDDDDPEEEKPLNDEHLKRSNVSHSPQRAQMESKLSKMVTKLIFVWAFAWTPYAIMAIWAMFFNSYNLSPLMGVIPLLFCKISAGANALIYGLRLPKFKSEVKKVLQLPIPACLANYIPGMGDMTITAYSSCNRQSTPRRKRKDGKDSPNFNSDLRRNKSMPEPSSGSEARCDTPRRVKSAKSPSAVRFSSMGSYPSTPPNLTPDRKGSFKSNHSGKSVKSILNTREMKGDSLDSVNDKVFMEEEEDNVNKEYDVFKMPNDNNDDYEENYDAKKIVQAFPPTRGSRKNGFPAVIIIHQVTKEKFATHRKKLEEVEKKKAISSSKIEEISMIDADDENSGKVDTPTLDQRNGSVESQDGNDSDLQSRQSPTLDEEKTCQDNRQDDKISMFGFESKSSAAELIKELLICLNDFDVDTEVSNIVDKEKRTNKIIENNSKNTVV